MYRFYWEMELEAVGIENLESVFFNRYGQFIYSEPRGRHAGYAVPEVGIHRGKLHRILFEEALAKLGPQHIHTGHRCVGVEQDDSGATIYFVDPSSGAERPTIRVDIVVACDGINSSIRKRFYPDEKMAFYGINTHQTQTHSYRQKLHARGLH